MKCPKCEKAELRLDRGTDMFEFCPEYCGYEQYNARSALFRETKAGGTDGVIVDTPIGERAVFPDIYNEVFKAKEQNIKTNRDIINAMTDEELAEWKRKYPADQQDPQNGYCRVYWRLPKPCRLDLKCRQCITEWLKAPAGKHQEIKE